MLTNNSIIGVLGSGAMGTGIAQVAAMAGHKVILCDNNTGSLLKSQNTLNATLDKLIEKQKITELRKNEITQNLRFISNVNELKGVDLIIEAIVEDLEIKKAVFKQFDKNFSGNCILATNTSSLSITSIAAACAKPERVIGIHFFNPAPIMPLVEIIPGLATSSEVINTCKSLISSWGKSVVLAKDTPGFIVNRVARPFYSEALRIYEEGIADMPTIDWAMKEMGGFKMGPFELMDLIGHDVNYVVTETVWKQLYYDPKFKPALSQKRLLEAGFLGRKSERGFYDYREGATNPEAKKDAALGQKIFLRILSMLINEAADSLYLGVASLMDIDSAMTKGVNYPKGLLKWADDIGVSNIVNELNSLRELYEEDRYRVCPLLKRMSKEGRTFYQPATII